jgi:hypothetical protein
MDLRPLLALLVVLALLALLLLVRAFLSDLFQVLSPCRYSVLIVVIGVVAFLLPAQGQDVLRHVVEWGPKSWWTLPTLAMVAVVVRWSVFLATVVLWALSSWYWARVILYFRPAGSPPDSDRQARLRVWV